MQQGSKYSQALILDFICIKRGSIIGPETRHSAERYAEGCPIHEDWEDKEDKGACKSDDSPAGRK